MRLLNLTLLLILSLFVGYSSFAAGIPTRVLSSGAVFPSLTDAIQAGPETIPFSPDETALNASINTSSPLTFGGGIAYATKSIGLGVSYAGSNSGMGGSLNHLVTGAVAFRYSKLSLGVDIGFNLGNASPSGSTISGSAIGFGLGFGGSSGTNFVAYLPSIYSFSPIVGVGYIDPERYNLEVDLSLPSITALGTGSTFTLSIGAVLYAGIFGVSYTVSNSYSLGFGFAIAPFYTFGLKVSMSKKLHILAQLITTGSANLGFTYGF